MNVTPNYNFSDILWAPARAMSAKKILIMTVFLLLALLLYDTFTYIAMAVDGENLDHVWSAYGFFPFFCAHFSTTVGLILYAAGIYLAILSIMLGIFAVAAIDFERMRGNPFMSIKETFRFTLARFPQIFLAEKAIISFMLFLLLLFFIFGLFGRIPFIGEWIISLFVVIPAFIFAMLGLFVFAVFLTSFLLLPAVAASQRTGETFNVILETFSTIIRQPFRWIGYTIYSIVVGKLASFVYAYACYRSTQFTIWAASLGGGEKVEQLGRNALSHLPVSSEFAKNTFSMAPGIDWSFSINQWARSGSDSTASYLMAFMLFLIFVSIVAYFLSVIATGQAYGYAAIRYFKDDYRISDEDSLFHKEEYVNPKIVDESP